MAVLIILVIVLAIAVALLIFKRDLLTSIFGSNVVRKVEKKKRIEGEIEVLKKQEKVQTENVIKSYDQKKKDLADSTSAQVNALQAQITSLKSNKETQTKLLDEERKVALDKVINEFDQKITNKKNQAKKLGYLIEAEQKNLQDVIDPNQPNQPTEQPKKILLESSTETGFQTAEVKVRKTKK